MLLATQIKAHELTLIIELRQKLTPLLSKALAMLLRPRKLNKYAKQCKNVYQNLSNLERKINKVTISNLNWFSRNTSRNSINLANSNMWNTKGNQQNRQPAMSLYVRPPNIVAAFLQAQNKNTKLLQEELALLKHKNCCFNCKKWAITIFSIPNLNNQ